MGQSIAFAGAGGKTMGMFALAYELQGTVLVTTTTHIGAWQLDPSAVQIVAQSAADLPPLHGKKVVVVSGPAGPDRRLSSVSTEVLVRLRSESLTNGWPLLIEADGARLKPLKAPRQDEPQIPAFSEMVVVVAGMGAIGGKLDGGTVHRPELFGQLSGLQPGATITARAVGQVLAHAKGGLQGVPSRARRIALLNQADTHELQAEANAVARQLADTYDAVLVASLRSGIIHAVHEPCAGIILAAGGATRFGRPKQLLEWHGRPLIRAVAETALAAGLSPVVVVTGANAASVERALEGLPIAIARNARWEEGQSSSIRTGLEACTPAAGAAVFLLADQPYVTPAVIRALTDMHTSEPAAIVAPLIQDNRRANPVLFDRETFADLRLLRADDGGRAIFSKHQVHYLPWHDERIALDIDTEQDYRTMLEDPQT